MTLLTPLTIRGVTLKNRICVSPMCQYSSTDGFANDWHLVHLGSRAVGGAALVFVEATAVTAEGRISPSDMGIWTDRHVEPLARIAQFVTSMGAVPGIQIAHAGRKASCNVPWAGGKQLTLEQGGWQTVGPSPIPFLPSDIPPRELSESDIHGIVEAFAAAARRAVTAGFRIIEIHAAHGYLLHEFLSPLSNRRTDRYGGPLHHRMRAALETAEAIRHAIPKEMPLFMRISSTDWVDSGWDLPQSIELARELKTLGVDVIDCSSGGLVPNVSIPIEPGYQVPFAAAIRKEAGIMTAAVGMITAPRQAEEIVASGKADLTLLAREMLREPYWALKAEAALGVKAEWPVQYIRAAQ